MIVMKIASDLLPPWTTTFIVEITVSVSAFLLPEPTPEEIEALRRADDSDDLAEKLEALALIVRMHQRHADLVGEPFRIELQDDLKRLSFSGAHEFEEQNAEARS